MANVVDKNDLVNFNKKYVQAKHQNIFELALKAFLLFGITCCNKPFFSTTKCRKGKHECQLSD